MNCKKCNYQLEGEEKLCPMGGEQVNFNGDANKKSELVQAIEQLKKGDEKGFSILYTHTYKYVYSRARMLSDNEQEIMDILQEVYISAYRNIGALKSSDSLYAWLKTITFHAGGKMLKKNRKEILLSEEHEEMLETLPDEESMTEDDYLNKQDIEAIRDCIKRLSDEHRTVIMAFYYDNLKVEEISELLSISAGTVKSRLHSARKKLKGYIEEQEKKQGYTFHSFGGVTLALAIGSLLQENMAVSESLNAVVFNNICNELGFTSFSQVAGINSVVREGTRMLKGKILKTIAGMGTKKLVALTIGVVGTVAVTGTAVVVGTTRDDNKVNQTASATETKLDEEETISDTTAPDIKLKDKVFTISDFAELTEELLIDTVTDDSKYEMLFAGYEKIAELDVVNDEYIASLKAEVEEQISLDGTTTDVPTAEGVYRVVLSFKDEYANEVMQEIYIVYDAPDPVVEETPAETSSTTSGNATTSNNNTTSGRYVNGYLLPDDNDGLFGGYGDDIRVINGIVVDCTDMSQENLNFTYNLCNAGYYKPVYEYNNVHYNGYKYNTVHMLIKKTDSHDEYRNKLCSMIEAEGGLPNGGGGCNYGAGYDFKKGPYHISVDYLSLEQQFCEVNSTADSGGYLLNEEYIRKTYGYSDVVWTCMGYVASDICDKTIGTWDTEGNVRYNVNEIIRICGIMQNYNQQ